METDAGAVNTLYLSGQDTELAHKSQEWGRDFDMLMPIFLLTTGLSLHSSQPFPIKRPSTFRLFGSGNPMGLARF